MTLSDRKLNDEAARLRALMRYSILDTPADPQYDKIVGLVRQTLGVPICAVTFIDRERQWIKARAGVDAVEMPRDISFCTHAIKQPGSFVVEDATRDPVFADNPLVTGDPFIRSYLGIPLRTPEGYQIGSLCVLDTQPRSFSETDVTILSGFANLVVDQLEMRMIASTDVLTGLRTRRDWMEQVKREVALAQRHMRPMSVALIDIDHFKRVNDTYGHSVGDSVLENTARLMSSTFRATDILGRVGGEEFAVALPESDGPGAYAVLNHVRAAVERSRLRLPNGNRIGCTISVGLAELHSGEDTLESLYDRADRALYASKETGRNRITQAK